MKKRLFIILVLCLCLLASCIGLKKNITDQGCYDNIVEGQTLMGEVEAMFGKPDSRNQTTQGETWMYSLSTARKEKFGKAFAGALVGLTPTRAHTFIVMFDQGGTVKFKSLSHDDSWIKT